MRYQQLAGLLHRQIHCARKALLHSLQEPHQEQGHYLPTIGAVQMDIIQQGQPQQQFLPLLRLHRAEYIALQLPIPGRDARVRYL